MTLSEKDGQLFYKLWLPLLDYVNEKCKVNKNVKDMANAKSLDPQVVKEIPVCIARYRHGAPRMLL